MKTLKFMLAAATAIGLASATQADQYNTTGFEKLAVGTSVTTGVTDNDNTSYFYYAGSVAEDNESVIAAADAELANIGRPRGAAAVDAGREKILQVSTGTDPLMRTYAPLNGSTPQSATALEGTDVYVDTLVQFTVTPYTDTVTPGSADKLMIYLKETTNEVNDVIEYSTNLVVVGGYCVNDGEFEAKEYGVTGVSVEPNTWHRLTVKVIANYGELDGYEHPAFQVYLDGNLCVFDSYAAAEDDTDTGFVAPFDSEEPGALSSSTVVFSLLCNGAAAASLQGVGFAGEGKVDDIVFGTVDPFATVYDFTFAFDTEKVSAVTYTVGGTEYDQARTFPEVEAGTEVQITSITYAQGWQAGSTNVVNLTPGLTEGLYTITGAGASLTIVPAEASAEDWAADPTQIADNTPAATQYPSLAGTALATADAKKLTVWATNVANVDFSDAVADADDYVEAFLLNCAVDDVAQEKEEFVLDISVAADGTITVSLPSGKDYNGTLQMKGSNDLSAWTNVSEASSSYKFYKYELSLPAAL